MQAYYKMSDVLTQIETVSDSGLYNQAHIQHIKKWQGNGYKVFTHDFVYEPSDVLNMFISRETTELERDAFYQSFGCIQEIYNGIPQFGIEYKNIPGIGFRLLLDMGEQRNEITEDQALAIIFQEIKKEKLTTV